METAAAGIAVVWLTLQLAHIVRKNYEFLRSVKGAPKELDRLVDLLADLDCMLEDAKSVLEEQKRGDISLPAPSPNLHRKLQRCEDALVPLEALVEKLRAALQKPNATVSKAWAAVLLAVKKKDVETMEERLHRSLMALQTSFIMNSSRIQLNSRQIQVIHMESTSKLVNEVTQLRSTLALPAAPDEGASLRPSRALDPSDAAVQVQSVDARRAGVTGRRRFSKYEHYVYRTFLGTIKVARRSSVGDQWDGSSTEERRITFNPSFFKSALEVQVDQRYGRISRTLRTHPTLSSNSRIFERCRRGDLPWLKDALSNNHYSPYSLDPIGRSLLHYAALKSQVEVCAFLLELGLDANRASDYGQCVKSYDREVETARFLVNQGRTEWRHDATYYRGPPEGMAFALMLDTDPLPLSVQDSEGNACLLDEAFLCYGYTRNTRWIPVLEQLVRIGALGEDSRFSHTLRDLLHYSRDPDDSEALAASWLDVLARAGVDVDDYLEGQSGRIHHDTYFDDGRRVRISWGNNRQIRLEWPCLVLNIFPALVAAPRQDDVPSHHYDLSAGKFEFIRNEPGGEWPFEYSYQNILLALRASGVFFPWKGDPTFIPDEVEYEAFEYLELVDLRFDRRMRRRADKLSKGKIKDGDIVLHHSYTDTASDSDTVSDNDTMPGGWIE
ncbi:MAG: hypothetical protein M1823_002498 [Watsoniomyces obsoletus]|nr:MAG: hypothetical protein M1823_002498 [Watsoniomyces obsoletus]